MSYKGSRRSDVSERQTGAYDLLDLITAWIVILWRFAATYMRAKHNRAEMPNSNIAMGIIYDKVLIGKVEFVGVTRRSYQKERGVSNHHVSFGRTVELSQFSASD